jgi:hypothetical protein
VPDYNRSALAPKTSLRQPAHHGSKEVHMATDDIDPSLRAGEPLLESLDDGFSPPQRHDPQPQQPMTPPGIPPEFGLGPQSPF